MPETVALTAPITKPNVTGLSFDQMILNNTAKSVYLTWFGNTGELFSASYPTPAINNPLGVLQPTGAVLLHAMNTGNNSTTSMIKKAFTQLQSDGYIPAGTISGTAD